MYMKKIEIYTYIYTIMNTKQAKKILNTGQGSGEKGARGPAEKKG